MKMNYYYKPFMNTITTSLKLVTCSQNYNVYKKTNKGQIASIFKVERILNLLLLNKSFHRYWRMQTIDYATSSTQ